MAYSRNIRGFSLIELAVVLSLAGILTALAVVQIGRDPLHGATRKIFSGLAFARMLAIAQQKPVRVVFYPNGHAYAEHVDNDNDGIMDPGERVKNYDLHPEFRGILMEPSSDITFSPLGMETRCSRSGTCVIKVLSVSDTSASNLIRVPASGRPEIEEGVPR